MENASKALIMAGGILVAIIVMSIGVYLFASFSGTGKEIQQKVDSRVLAEFNNNFLQYVNDNEITIHDIVSLANFAKKNNQKFEFKKTDIDNPYYLEVYLNDSDLAFNQRELTFLDDYTEIIEKNSRPMKTYNSEIKQWETHTKYYIATIADWNVQEGNNKRVKKIVFKPASGQKEANI